MYHRYQAWLDHKTGFYVQHFFLIIKPSYHETVIAPDLSWRLSNLIFLLMLDDFIQFIFTVVDLSSYNFTHFYIFLWFHCLPGKKCNIVFKMHHVFDIKLKKLDAILIKSYKKLIDLDRTKTKHVRWTKDTSLKS